MKQWARTWLKTVTIAAFVAAALSFAAAPRAKAQDGSISGTLIDLYGQPWPDYTLSIEGDQGTKTDTKSDKAGKYAFNGLKAGTYKITVMLPMQKEPYVAGQVKVSTGQNVPADINLQELVAKKNPDYITALKKYAEESKKMTGLKAHNLRDNGAEAGKDKILVAVSDPRGLEQQGSATHGPGGPGVLPFVTDDKGAFQIQLPLECGFREQPRLGLPTGAFIGFIMGAHENVIQRETLAQKFMHAIEFAPGQRAAGQRRLIGGGDQNEPRRLQLSQQRYGGLDYFELFQRERADLTLAVDDGLIQDAVPFDEYPGLHACHKA